MQHTYTPTADGLSHARAREGGGYPKATGTAPAFTYGRSETVGQTTVTARYFYDGWNRVAEYSGQDLATTYTWGLNLSRTMQGAGGVGGLLAVLLLSAVSGSSVLFPTFDGNGNISEYLDEEGIAVAHFEYDPFGNLVVDSFENAADFPYRFSTKPQDMLSGCYYYGYRWYDPLTGRWPSRYPIGEKSFWATAANLDHLIGIITDMPIGSAKNTATKQSQNADQRNLNNWIAARVVPFQATEAIGLNRSLDYSFVITA